MHNNSRQREEKKKADKENYFRELDLAREELENTCPTPWRKMLNHIKRHCRLKSMKLDDADGKMAKMYYHKQELGKLYSEMGGFYEEE